MHNMHNIKVFLHHSTEAGCEPSRPPVQLVLGTLLGLTRPGRDADRSLCALRVKAHDLYLCLPTRLPGLEINGRDSIPSYLGSENKQRLFPRRALSVDQLKTCFLWGRNWICILMCLISRCKTVPWLRRLVDGLSPRWPRFDPSPLQVRSVVDRVALRHGFCRVLRLSPVSITLSMLPLLLCL